MPYLSLEKVQMDTIFKNCQHIYNKLSKLLELVDVKQVGDINHINGKLLSLSTDMYKILCVAESVFICDQNLKGNNVIGNVGLFKFNTAHLGIKKKNPVLVNRHVQCNIQNSIPSDLGQHSSQATPVQKVTKSCQTSYVIKQGAQYVDNITSNIGLLNAAHLSIKKSNPVFVNRHVQCNIQNSIPSELGKHSSQAMSVQKVAKSCQTSDVIKEGASLLNISDDKSPQTITGKIRSEFHRNISYKDQKYLCNICSITLNNVEDTIVHIKSQQHKNICKDPSLFTVKLLKDECSIDNFWSFIPQYLKICKIYIQPTGFTCTLCKSKLTCSPFAMYIHISGKAHMNNVPKSLLFEYNDSYKNL